MQVKILSRRRKGGRGRVQTVESIPSWARPYLERVGQEAQAQYKAGNLGRVAGTNTNLQQAFGMGSTIKELGEEAADRLGSQQGRLAELASTGGRDALMESAAYAAKKGASEMGKQYGAAGTLGSARQAVQQGAMEAELTDKASQAAIQNKLAAENALQSSVGAGTNLASGTASSLAQLGSTERDISQQSLDANWQALQRYASTIYGNPARQSGVGTQGGGK